MNVDLVQANLPGLERPTPERKVQSAPPPPSADSGSTPKPETNNSTNSTSVPLLIPEHDVKVQLDTEANDALVYQVLDKQSGSLVLQVPSEEELRAMLETEQLLQRIAQRSLSGNPRAGAAAAAKTEGEK